MHTYSLARLRPVLIGLASFVALWPSLALAQFTTNGDAFASATGSDCFVLTPAANGQLGSVWSNTTIDPNFPFDITARINLGANDGGADGAAFVLHTAGPATLGIGGFELGYGGIVPSIAVEFDTYQNGASNDPVFDHLSIQSNGSNDHGSPFSLTPPVGILPGNINAEDGLFHELRFRWRPAANLFEVYVDCQLRQAYSGNIRQLLGNSTTVTYGFTAATGALNNLQEVCFLDSLVAPGNLTTLSICEGDTVTLTAGLGTDYVWAPITGLSATDQQTVQAFPTTVTAYTAAYLDACGALVVDTFTIQVDPVTPLSVNLGPDFSLCPAEDSLLNPGLSAAFQYEWQDGSTGPVFVATGPGTYFVEVRDGCSVGSDTVVITPDNLSSPTFSLQDSICIDELTTINITSPILPGATYNFSLDGATVISGGGTTPIQLFWTTPGIKTVCLTVARDGCVEVICENVVVSGRPQVFINPVADQCYPDSSFIFTTTGTADIYQWNFGISASPPTFQGANPPPITYQSPGVKIVTLTVFDNGCQADSAVTTTFEVFDPPSAAFSVSSGAICLGETVDFSYAGMVESPTQQFSWNFGSGAVPTTSTLVNPFPVQYVTPGIKTVTLEVTLGPCVVTFIDTVEVSDGPIVNAGRDTSFCEGDGGVQLLSSVSGGVGQLSYVWTCDRAPNCGFDSTNILQPVVNPDVSNPTEDVVYYLTVIDSSGCGSNTDSVIVTVKAKPKLDAGPDISICPPNAPGDFLNGGPATDNQAPLPFDYQWIPNDGLGNPTDEGTFARPDSTTIYVLTATSINGCTSEATTVDTTSSVVVVVKDKPMAEAGPDTGLCFGDSILLQGFAFGAGPDYTYSWTASPSGSLSDPTSPTPVATPTQTTVYTLVATSNGCDSDGDEILIEVDTKPTVSPGNSFSACLFEPVLLDARAAGDPEANDYTYNWSPTMGLSDSTIPNPIATPSQTTTYSVFAETEFGCISDVQQVTITLKPTPIVDLLAQDTAVCSDDTLTLIAQHTFTTTPANDINYQWEPTDFDYEFVFDSVVQVAPSRNGFIVVEAFVSSGECPTRDSVFVTVDPAITATATADTTRICQGTSTQLFSEGGRGNPTYEWTPAIGLDDPNAQSPIASPPTTTTYVISLREGACIASDTIELIVNPAPALDFVTTIEEGCGELLLFFEDRSENATSVVWDFGDSSALTNERNPIHVYTEPGDYFVTLTGISEGGCIDSLAKGSLVVRSLATADFDSEPTRDARLIPTTSVQFSDMSEGAVAWLWDFGDGGTASEQNPIHRFDVAGTYTVTLTVTDSLGCTQSISYGPYEVLPPEALFPNIFSPNGDGINDVFRVQYGGDAPYSITLLDRWGREMFRSDDPTQEWDGTLANGGEAPEGVYFYVATIGGSAFQRTVTLLR